MNIDPFNNSDKYDFDLDPDSFGGTDFPPICSEEEEKIIKEIYKNNPQLNKDIYENDDCWIQTYTGKKFFPLNPRLSDICIEDIAHALSNICRFTGHCRDFHSVAFHSVLVSYVVSKQNSLYGLLHDASEAYLMDLATPLKRSGAFENYKIFEKNLQNLILDKFGIKGDEPAEVKEADTKMLATEARDLLDNMHPEWMRNIKHKPYPFKIVSFSPKEAKNLFLDRFYELTQL